jgi:hypothetical protein
MVLTKEFDVRKSNFFVMSTSRFEEAIQTKFKLIEELIETKYLVLNEIRESKSLSPNQDMRTIEEYILQGYDHYI